MQIGFVLVSFKHGPVALPVFSLGAAQPADHLPDFALQSEPFQSRGGRKRDSGTRPMSGPQKAGIRTTPEKEHSSLEVAVVRELIFVAGGILQIEYSCAVVIEKILHAQQLENRPRGIFRPFRVVSDLIQHERSFKLVSDDECDRPFRTEEKVTTHPAVFSGELETPSQQIDCAQTPLM